MADKIVSGILLCLDLGMVSCGELMIMHAVPILELEITKS